MRTGRFVTLALMLVAMVGTQITRFDGQSWRHHIEVLAADDMEGRGLGTSGLRRAESYVVGELKRASVSPAGSNGYYQPVPLASREILEQRSGIAFVRNGNVEPLVVGDDAFFLPLVGPTAEVDAPLVFLGYGVKVPELNYDDFEGLDLKGKIGVTVCCQPDGINPQLASHYLAYPQRWQQFRDAGLIGWIWIPGPDQDWPATALNRPRQVTILAGDEFNDARGLRFFAWLSPARAAQILDGTGHTLPELFAAAKDSQRLPRFNLPVNARVTVRVRQTPIASSNVLGKLEGQDPQLKREVVVLSAHVDHLGIGAAVNGDRIYNGANDNASGIAVLLDLAAALKEDAARLKRSVLFAFFTAEEPGMMGSRYFLAHPTVAARSLAADINIDQINPLVPLQALFVYGSNESDLGDAARRVLVARHVALAPDPDPQVNQFVCCSDQRSFVLNGVPALALKVGFAGELLPVLQRWRSEHAHKPSDDLVQPLNSQTAGRFEEIVWSLLLDVANHSSRPTWKSDSFYKRYASR